MATQETIDAYMAAWNETDETKRRGLLEKCWRADATYTDPMTHAENRDALVAVIAGFQSQMPGAGIKRISGIDEHHGQVRFAWKLEGGPQQIEGIDVGRLGDDGKLLSIVGFFGPPPAM